MGITITTDLSQWDGDAPAGTTLCSSRGRRRLPGGDRVGVQHHSELSPHDATHHVRGTEHDDDAAASTTTTPPTTVPVTTTSAPALPPAPQPTAEDAANALVGYWASGNRAAAMRVATVQAVANLFSVAYPNGLAINRGCSSSFSPIVCTFGAPGGGPVNAPIYQLDEVQAPSGGWYVSTVQIEG